MEFEYPLSDLQRIYVSHEDRTYILSKKCSSLVMLPSVFTSPFHFIDIFETSKLLFDLFHALHYIEIKNEYNTNANKINYNIKVKSLLEVNA